MSVKASSAVWSTSEQKGGALLILLALADFADDDGYCWPSVETLAQKARMTTRNAQYVLRSLEAAGEVSITEGGGRYGSNGYIIASVSQGVQYLRGGRKTRHGGGEKRDTEGVKPTSPKPSLENHHIEPPRNDLAPSPETSPAPPRAKRAKRAQPAQPEPSDSATRDPRPLFDAFLVTFPTAPASVAGRFNSTCNRLGYTLEQWGRWLQERETTDFLSRGIITRNNALDRFSRWVEDARPRATARNAPARRRPAGAPDDWATIVYTHDGTRRASVLFLPLMGLDRFAPPETWPAWLREFEGGQ